MRAQGEEVDCVATPMPCIAVHYARRGSERIWLHTLPALGPWSGIDGPRDAFDLHRRFAEAVGVQFPLSSNSSSERRSTRSGNGGSGGDESNLGSVLGSCGDCRQASVRLRVVPARPGGPQVDVSPRDGESLPAFLASMCRDDHGVFQLRAEFGMASGEDFVLVRVALPGTATSDAAAAASTDFSSPPPMQVEQFECEASAPVASLKLLLRRRTGFPIDQMVLLLGCRRLHEELPMKRVAAAAVAAGSLQLHLSTRGALVFLRREGQGWPITVGGSCNGDELPCTCTLVLPPYVRGSRSRTLRFHPKRQTVRDLRHAVQSVSGLPPAGLRFLVVGAGSRQPSVAAGGGSRRGGSSRSGGVNGSGNVRGREQSRSALDSQSLEAFGLADGSKLEVRVEPTEEDFLGDRGDILLDTPTAGSTADLLENASARLGLGDGSRLVLFASGDIIRQGSDLSSAPLADGAVLSAYVTQSLVMSYSIFADAAPSVAPPPARTHNLAPEAQTAANADSEFAAAASRADRSNIELAGGHVVDGGAKPSTVACLSSDTIAEVRERILSAIIGAGSLSRAQVAALRRCKVIAVDRAAWIAGAAECRTLSMLAKLAGYFSPCDDDARLSRLGIADEFCHLVLVPEKVLLVEVQVYSSNEHLPTLKKLRVPDTFRLSELVTLLDGFVPKGGRCRWSLGSAPGGSSTVGGEQDGRDSISVGGEGGRHIAPAGPPPKKRRSFGGVCSVIGLEAPEPVAGLSVENEIKTDEFLRDLCVAHPAVADDLPNHFMCPISCEVMREPVFVVGSGNTYERECIEKHFQRRHTDPLSNEELRRPGDRRLVPNHSLRSQIIEVERSFVNLKLAAYVSEKSRSSVAAISDAGLVRTLSWCAALLRGAV
eukprot:TRINITY_DN20940_c0_g1_i1.p1 TRINITY_DN20940_c0_g1~~TRINITY_DN20940_c0_g1_i1.p1  ORF type:complete len:883 (+),score=128.37 TRINITY_DN20940_c0_g1_i1:184-2832(+)